MTERRTVLKGIAAMPLAAILADPRLARAAAAALDTVSTTTAAGRRVSGALARPEGPGRGGVLLIHEWWGLNDQIKSVAAELAKEGYLALAADLYDGRVTDEREVARELAGSVDPQRATRTLVAWVEWLREQPESRGRVATIGWCFGGGWSLNASLATPVDATVIYYGRVDKSAQALSALQGPVLGHFATQDRWIDEAMVGAFEKSMDAAAKQYTTYWYDAQHAFANPTTARYDAEDAALAWQRTLAFLERHLAEAG